MHRRIAITRSCFALCLNLSCDKLCDWLSLWAWVMCFNASWNLQLPFSCVRIDYRYHWYSYKPTIFGKRSVLYCACPFRFTFENCKVSANRCTSWLYIGERIRERMHWVISTAGAFILLLRLSLSPDGVSHCSLEDLNGVVMFNADHHYTIHTFQRDAPTLSVKEFLSCIHCESLCCALYHRFWHYKFNTCKSCLYQAVSPFPDSGATIISSINL